ncbi:MAG: N-acetylmuramoyl-L-alanine amidase [Chloroflexi bacterium]|nr:N-acetylmuramoyl-L-alanine amidase [Chloroflexota bacterium]
MASLERQDWVDGQEVYGEGRFGLGGGRTLKKLSILITLFIAISLVPAYFALFQRVDGVPDVRGKTVAEAKTLLSRQGFEIEIEGEPYAGGKPGLILSQTPEPGSSAFKGSTIKLRVDKGKRPGQTRIAQPGRQSPGKPGAKKPGAKKWKVCIDPGHQRGGDAGMEPVGPGSSEVKPKVTGGASGVSTGVPEYEFNLKLSEKISAELKKEGVEVLMTRTTNDVEISNVGRAEMANRWGADLFLRIHADSSADQSVSGISVLEPAKDAWTTPIYDKSASAAKAIHDALIPETGRPDRGIAPRADLTGFNWSKVPSVLVESGFLSNPEEDRLLNTDVYQDRLSKDIAKGVEDFFNGR